MKKIFFVCLLLLSTAVSKAQNKVTDTQAISMLRKFYTAYITTVANDQSRIMNEKLSLLKSQYCTKKVLVKIPKIVEQTDSDPFLKAQDSDVSVLKTLSITRNFKKPNLYTVFYSFKNEFSNEKIIINLVVINQNGSLKIDNIL